MSFIHLQGATVAYRNEQMRKAKENEVTEEIEYIPSQYTKWFTARDTWKQMYVQAKSVIVPCRYCASHNAVSNPTCVRCGGPMGEVR